VAAGSRFKARKIPAGAPDTETVRFDTTDEIKRYVSIRAAGHCELCGADLTRDLRLGKRTGWGEIAHILPASPRGPRAPEVYSAAAAAEHTNDPDNLMLLCPGCHTKIDKDAAGYPLNDLQLLHHAHIDRIRLAAEAPAYARAVPAIVLSQHFATLNNVRDVDLGSAMSAEGLSATCDPIRIVLGASLSSGKRDKSYWDRVADTLDRQLMMRLNRASPDSADMLALAALADIPSLVMLGQLIGDRMPRRLFSPNRATGLRWPDPVAPLPEFQYRDSAQTEGPRALVMSLSARIPHADVEAALPGARIAELTVREPNYGLVTRREVIDAFRQALQPRLSELEAEGAEPIHLFMAVPAVLAVEFGALLTTQHRHAYRLRDRSEDGRFVEMLDLNGGVTAQCALDQ